MILNRLSQIVRDNPKTNPLYLRNLLKESLQYYLLNFIANTHWGENLLFKGGSCLRMFFALPRLSEDLDLDIENPSRFLLKDFLKDLKRYFSADLQYRDLEVKISRGERILYLKFPLLEKLGLARKKEDSRILFLRIDLAEAVGKNYKTELSLASTAEFSFVVRRYSLGDLFAGKIAAILTRETKEKTQIKPRIKGRDYFDLAWFLEKRVKPNFSYLQEIVPLKNRRELKRKLENKIRVLDLTVLKEDLGPLFREKEFVKTFSQNYQSLTLRLLRENL